MSEQKSSPVNELESNLIAQASAVVDRAQDRLNDRVSGLLAARGVNKASDVRLSDDGKFLLWTEQSESGGPGNSVEPSAIGLVSDKEEAGEVSSDEAAN